MKRAFVFSLLLVSVLAGTSACAADPIDKFYPADPDPWMGDWSGRWSSGVTVDPEIHARVIAMGNNRYLVKFMAKLDMRAPLKAEQLITIRGKKGKFVANGITAEFKGDTIRGGDLGGDDTFVLKKVTRLSPAMGKKPPAGATILFDGTSLDAWQESKGWEVTPDGIMLVRPGGGDIMTKTSFKDCDLHIEFRLSYMPKARGQQRSNSGVFFQNTYEVQVLDSYGLVGFYDECGALYKVAPPKVNACAPPLQWQTYDISYRAPRYDAAGKLTAFPRMTVVQNGVLIHNDQVMPQITGWTEKDRLAPPPKDPLPFKIQNHGNYLQFRNIWLVEK